jgi:hypothetical protein
MFPARAPFWEMPGPPQRTVANPRRTADHDLPMEA